MSDELPQTASIKGFKQSDFKRPSEFFEDGKVPDGLPDSIRLYIRGKNVDVRGKHLSINVYRLVSGLGTKERKDWVGRIEGNDVPEDHDIGLRFGPGRYVWIVKWVDPVQGEKGLISDEVNIAEDAREAHLAWRAANQGQGSPTASPRPLEALPAALPVAPGLNDPLAVLRLVQLGEDRALDQIERINKILLGRPSQAANEGPVVDAHKKAAKIMEEAFEYKAKALEAVHAKETPLEKEEAVPPFLKPFMPLIEKNIDKLLGGGPVAEGMKEVILSTEEFARIMADPQQMAVMADALRLRFGAERTEGALRFLLDDAPKADETLAEKVVGKVASRVAKAAVKAAGARRR